MSKLIRRVALTAVAGLAFASLAIAAQPGADGDFAAELKAQPAVHTSYALKGTILGAAFAGKRMVAVGDHGIVLLSDDDGATFRQATNVPTRATLTSVSFVSDKEGWAAGHWGSVLHTIDGGENWTVQRQDITVDQPLLSVLFTDEQNGIVTGIWSLALRTRDGGKSWEPIKTPAPPGAGKTDANLFNIFTNKQGLTLIAAEQGIIYRSADAGVTWELIQSPYHGSFWSGIVLDDGSVLVGGLQGKVYRSADAGKSWTEVASGVTSSITSLAQAADGTVVGVGLEGVVITSKDHGQTFTNVQRADRLNLHAVLINSRNEPVIFSKEGIAAGS
jgi:photosystem II stability/assembly factor-like uncharacterized protein